MADTRVNSDLTTPVRMSSGPLPRVETPIVPKTSIAGRALAAVVAIMTFLASLTAGAVMLVHAAASEWQADVSREITIQVRPMSGRDIEGDIRRASEITRAVPGVAEVKSYSREESLQLLEPWLGTGLALDDLPVPRLIVVKIAPDWVIDFSQLRRALVEQVPSASLDDHRSWIERMRAMTSTALAGGVVILGLVFAATVLSVTFATRGAMAANRPIIEVLHFIGARHGYIAGHFQRAFLILGLKGGAIGGGAAIVVFLLAEPLSRWVLGAGNAEEVSALFGSFSIGVWGYIVVLGQVLLIALVTAVTSRRTVSRTLDAID